MKKPENFPDMKFILSQARQSLGQEKADRVWQSFLPIFEAICRENPHEPKAVQAHTLMRVYPAVAYYRALQQQGLSREQARDIIYRGLENQAEKNARSMRAMMKIPGLYKLMPRMWRIVTKKNFGTDAGFRFSFYDTGSRRVKFDMTACPYCQVCRRYGCPELISCYCHTDDVANGNLHEKLKWNRSVTMGEGGELCDFDLIVLP